MMNATPKELDFTQVDYNRTPLPKPLIRGKKGDSRVMSRKQLRARARRSKKGARSPEFKALYKPVEEWDAEELARGRVRDRHGSFGGRPPHWITRELHEESMTRFKQIIKDGMNAETNTALQIINKILTDTELDDKGRPLVAASTKLDAAKFLIEHAVGKPTQRQETDISVKLQGILASTIITPGQLPAALMSGELTSPRSEEDFIDADWSDEED